MSIAPAVFAVVLAAAVQGYGGFGFGIVAMAVLAMLRVPMESASAFVTVAATLLVAVLAWLSRRDGKIAWDQVALICAGALVGVPLGYLFLVTFGDQPAGRVVLGLVLVGFCIAGLLKPPAGRGKSSGPALPVGVLSGFLGGAFVTGGPPVVLYLYSRAKDPRTMKPTIQVIFLVVCIFRLATAAGSKVFFRRDVKIASAISAPLALVLLGLGHHLSCKSSPAVFARVVQMIIGLTGAVLVVRAIQDLL